MLNGVLTVLSAPVPQPTIAPVTVSATNLAVAVTTGSGYNCVLLSPTHQPATTIWHNESAYAGNGGSLLLNAPPQRGRLLQFVGFWVY